MAYIKLFYDCLDAIEPLTDEERGRLLTALLRYARREEVPELPGGERYLFPILRGQIDRDRMEYDRFVERQRVNGAKGGRPRKNPDVLEETHESQEKDKKKEKDKYKDHEQDEDEETGFAAVAAACRERVKLNLSESALRELEGFAGTVGTECCLRALDIAQDAGKATWPYIRSILKAKQEQGVRCLADWDRLEAQRAASRQQGGSVCMAGVQPGQSLQPSGERIARNTAWMDSFLEEQGIEMRGD